MDLKKQNEILIDALDHIMRTASASRTQTRRLRWISERARCAIDGSEDWRDIDLPKKAKLTEREKKMQHYIDNHLHCGQLKND